MKAHGLLLDRHTGNGEERRHDGRIAVDRSDTRWCSDGFEIGCDNGEKVRIAFTLDCCDREAISWVATTGGIDSSDIRDLMIESVERRFGLVDKLPKPIAWLSDNGSPYTALQNGGASIKSPAPVVPLMGATSVTLPPPERKVTRRHHLLFRLCGPAC